MDYKYFLIISLLSTKLCAHNQADHDYSAELNNIKNNLQEISCNTEKQCDCYKDVIENLEKEISGLSDEANEDVQLMRTIYENLSPEERKRFFEIIGRGIHNKCENKKPHAGFTKEDIALCKKVDKFAWEQEKKKAPYYQRFMHWIIAGY